MQACVAGCLWMIEDCGEFTLRQAYSSQKLITNSDCINRQLSEE